ncbi:MAG: NADAR family protein, partial [Acetatifactor sp.]|nr:NADAR family protein [Acetatifactor sp.]
FMMAQKAELFGDEEIRKQILESQTPDHIKALGRKVRGFDQELWDKVKYAIVLNGNWCKFSQNRRLQSFLLSTGDSVLVEASPYDTIWGIGLSADSPDAQKPQSWCGQNLLGFALMEVRDELRRVTQNEGLCDWSLVDR